MARWSLPSGFISPSRRFRPTTPAYSPMRYCCRTSAWARGWRTTSRKPARSMSMELSGRISVSVIGSCSFCSGARPCLRPSPGARPRLRPSTAHHAAGTVAQGAQLRAQGIEIDRLGIQEPLEEDPVERRHGDDGQALSLGRLGHDATQARLVHVADAAVELLEPCAELGTSLDALEDEVEDHPPELGLLAQRLRKELPARFCALLEGRQGEDPLNRSARDLVVYALGHPEQQLLLGPEVPEDGALRDADLLGQQIERRALDAAAREEPHGGLEDRLLGADPALLTRSSLGAFGPARGRRTGRLARRHNCPEHSVQFPEAGCQPDSIERGSGGGAPETLPPPASFRSSCTARSWTGSQPHSCRDRRFHRSARQASSRRARGTSWGSRDTPSRCRDTPVPRVLRPRTRRCRILLTRWYRSSRTR